MDFEQLAKEYQKMKSPQNNATLNSEGSAFLEYLKNEEKESKRKYQRMYVLYAIGAIAYMFVFLINPDKDLTMLNRIAGTCFIGAFGILFFITRNKFSELNKSSFLQSPKEFLANARLRHTFWNKKQIWLLPVLVLINLGATFSLLEKFQNTSTFTNILFIQIGFWSLMIFGYYMGIRSWTKNKKPILRKIEKMLTSFDEH